jgi:AcrR family transcriptional regulator
MDPRQKGTAFATLRPVFAIADETAPIGSAQWWRDRYLLRLRAKGRELSIEGICAAALDVIDRGGLGELTMRRVAEELGTGAASLYRHFASREELLVEVADLVLGELEAPDRALEWREAVEQLADDLRTLLLGHRGVVLVASNAPLLGPNAMRVRELFWSAMDRDGCSPEFAVQTYASVIHFVVSSAIFSAAAMRRGAHDQWSGKTSSGILELLDLLPSSRYPTVLKLSKLADKPDPEHDFHFGLRALLDGISSSEADRSRRIPVSAPNRQSRPGRTRRRGKT